MGAPKFYDTGKGEGQSYYYSSTHSSLRDWPARLRVDNVSFQKEYLVIDRVFSICLPPVLKKSELAYAQHDWCSPAPRPLYARGS